MLKVTRAVDFKGKKRGVLYLGNLDASRLFMFVNEQVGGMDYGIYMFRYPGEKFDRGFYGFSSYIFLIRMKGGEI